MLNIYFRKNVILQVIIFVIIGNLLYIGCGDKKEITKKSNITNVKMREDWKNILSSINEDIPIYIASLNKLNYKDDSIKELLLETDSSYDDVKNFYQLGLPEKNWDVIESSSSNIDDENSLIIECEKEKRKLLIYISEVKEEKKSVVQILIKIKPY